MKKYKVVFTVDTGLTITLKQTFDSYWQANAMAANYLKIHKNLTDSKIKEVQA